MKNGSLRANDRSPLTQWCFGVAIIGAVMCSAPQAQTVGVTTQGSTGGLVIPSAEVLERGAMAVSYGNYQEPQLGTFSTQQNMSFGIGLLPHVELFGRYTNYNNPLPDSILVNGVRDLSANIKFAVPTGWLSGPKIAVGVNDVTGGAVNYMAEYVVASDQYGPLDLSVGVARGRAVNRPATFNGAFGGAALRLGESGLSVIAEHDGQQKHAGVRWSSQPLVSWGQAQLTASLQRSSGGVTPAGLDASANTFALSLMVPFGGNATRPAHYQPAPNQALPDPAATPDVGGLQPTVDDRLASLRKALISVGLERVRVGVRQGLLGTLLVVEYENHRYGQNEVDAIGLVLGLGAEMAPPSVQRVHAVAFKDGLRLHETSVGVADYSAFLRDGPLRHVQDSLSWDRLPTDQSDATRWIDVEPTPASAVRIEIKPDLNYALGTEIGAFDYALAANVQAIAPLWRGARVYSSYIVPVGNSSNTEVGKFFEDFRQRRGLKTVALQQSFWLGRQVLAKVSAGRFYYDATGVQADAALFMPNSDDLVRLRGAAYNQAPGGYVGDDRALAASYRRMLSSTMSVEAGMQRYSDGTYGPTLEWNQWFGDVGVQLFYRRGADRQFAGLQLSLPLTPRQGMSPGPVVFSGASQYAQSLRTRITDSKEAANLVQPGAVRSIQLDTSLDTDMLNAGRLSQRYLVEQAYRMREAFYTYARQSLR